MAANRNRIVASAQKYLQKAQYGKAIAEYQRLLDEDPKDIRTLLKVGDIYVKMGDNASAADTFIRIAVRYQEEGSAHKAIAVYKQALKLVPNRTEALFSLSELYVDIGLVTEAAAGFSELAKQYEEGGRTKEMCAMYKRVVELEPENIPGRVRLAELYVREEMREDAVEEFRVILDQLRRHHRRTDFIKVAERLLFYEPDNLALVKEVARVYVDKGDAQRALARLQQAFRLAPRDIEVLELLADTFRDLGQLTKTASVLRELATVHEECGEIVARDAALRRLLEIEPADEDARHRLAGGWISPPALVADVAPAQTTARSSSADVGERSAPAAPHEVSFDELGEVGGEIEKRLTEIEIYWKYGLKEQAIREGDALANAYPRDERVARLVARIYEESGALALAAHALARFGGAMGDSLGRGVEALAGEILRLDPSSTWALAVMRGGAPASAESVRPSSPSAGFEIEVDESSLVLDVESSARAAGNVLPAAAEADPIVDAVLDDQDGDVEFSAPAPPPVRRVDAASRAVAAFVRADDLDDGLIPVDAPISEFSRPLVLANELNTAVEPLPQAPVAPLIVSAEAAAVIEEVDFFLIQGLREESRATLREAIARYPNEVALTVKLNEIDMVGGLALDEPSVGEVIAQVAAPAADVGADAVSIGDLIGDGIFEAEALVPAQTSDTHLDLGKAYVDMSLWDEAVEEFRRAKADPRLAADAGVLLAHSLRQMGRCAEALAEIDCVLALATLAPAQKRAAIFERAAILETTGDMNAALNGYRSIAHEDPTYRDVAARMHRLAAMLSRLGGAARVTAAGEPKARG